MMKSGRRRKIEQDGRFSEKDDCASSIFWHVGKTENKSVIIVVFLLLLFSLFLIVIGSEKRQIERGNKKKKENYIE